MVFYDAERFPAWRHSPAPPLNISIVIAAHNEARHIEHKLRTLLAQDYEPASLQIILASDGSTAFTGQCLCPSHGEVML